MNQQSAVATKVGRTITPSTRPIRSMQGTNNNEYNLPDRQGVVNWARYRGRDQILLKLSETLAALKESAVPVYRSLYDQAEQFFREVKFACFKGDLPAILPVMVPHVGKIPGQGLGALYHLRYNTMSCVIPERIMVGEWRRFKPH